MQSHLTEGNTEEEAETRFPLHPEGNRGCMDWVASGEEGMEDRDKDGTEEGRGRRGSRRGRRESELQEHEDTGAVCSQLCLEM